jgi:hypothetical protein
MKYLLTKLLTNLSFARASRTLLAVCVAGGASISIAPSAFAKTASTEKLRAPAAQDYREESCSLRLAGEPVSFYGDASESVFVVQMKDEPLDLSAVYQKAKEHSRPASDEDLVVQVVKEDTKKKSKFDDGCFKGASGSFRRDVKILKVSAHAAEQLSIAKDQTLKLKCTWQSIDSTDRCTDPTAQ